MNLQRIPSKASLSVQLGRPNELRCERSGFTLLELIVTVSIFVILAALISLGVRSMKHSAESTKCAANLKSLCVAAETASVDNSGKYPAMRVFPWDPDGYLANSGSGFYLEAKAPSIGEALGPYLGMNPESTMDIDPTQMPDVFQCAAAKRNVNKAWINRFGAYRYNYYAIWRSTSSSRAMLFIDACWNDWPEEDFSHQKPIGLNVAYADGHVKFMNYASYSKLNPASSEEKYNRLFTQGWLE